MPDETSFFLWKFAPGDKLMATEPFRQKVRDTSDGVEVNEHECFEVTYVGDPLLPDDLPMIVLSRSSGGFIVTLQAIAALCVSGVVQ